MPTLIEHMSFNNDHFHAPDMNAADSNRYRRTCQEFEHAGHLYSVSCDRSTQQDAGGMDGRIIVCRFNSARTRLEDMMPAEESVLANLLTRCVASPTYWTIAKSSPVFETMRRA